LVNLDFITHDWDLIGKAGSGNNQLIAIYIGAKNQLSVLHPAYDIDTRLS
jgi:hypothetical protein